MDSINDAFTREDFLGALGKASRSAKPDNHHEPKVTRIVPTKAGWWLIEADPQDTVDGLPYEAVLVLERGTGRLLINGRSPARVDERPDIVWICQVPSPEECIALAEFGRAYWAMDAADDTDGTDADLVFDWQAAKADLLAATGATHGGDDAEIAALRDRAISHRKVAAIARSQKDVS